MDDQWLLVRINSAVAAMQSAARRNAGPTQCDQVPSAGCEYEIRWASVLGNRLDCRNSTYRIGEAKEGWPVVILVRSEAITCPPQPDGR